VILRHIKFQQWVNQETTRHFISWLGSPKWLRRKLKAQSLEVGFNEALGFWEKGYKKWKKARKEENSDRMLDYETRK